MKEKLILVLGNWMQTVFKPDEAYYEQHDEVLNTIHVYTLKPKQEIDEFIRATKIDEFELMRYARRYCQLPDMETAVAINNVGVDLLDYLQPAAL